MSRMNPQYRPRSSRPLHDKKARGPRRVRDGLKLKSMKEGEPVSALAKAWLALLASVVGEDELAAGLEYARSGQVVRLDIDRGAIVAPVQGSAGRPYDVRIDVEILDESQWRSLVQRLSKEAIHSARLLSAKASNDVHDVFDDVEVELVPAEPGAFSFKCTCARSKPCRHIATAAYIVADRLEREPALIFTLRGLPYEELLERLRHARQIRTRGVAMAHADPMIPETQQAVPPLEECLDEFWRARRALGEVEDAPPTRHVEHALLRRLGPSPLKGRFPIAGLLASIYDTVSRHATELRDRAEGIDAGSGFASDAEADENGEGPDELP